MSYWNEVDARRQAHRDFEHHQRPNRDMNDRYGNDSQRAYFEEYDRARRDDERQQEDRREEEATEQRYEAHREARRKEEREEEHRQEEAEYDAQREAERLAAEEAEGMTHLATSGGK